MASAKKRHRARPETAIKRFHGLGDIVLLLPVLDKIHESGHPVHVATRPEWVSAFSELRPEFEWAAEPRKNAVDLDALTASAPPTEHRTDEFARLLGISPPFNSPRIKAPSLWTAPYEEHCGCIVFAPEAEHKARRAPADWAKAVADALSGRQVVLVGKDRELQLRCSADYRGTMTVPQLFGLLAVAGAVICMDSGVLHIAAALGIPTVAVFGGVDPVYRVRPEQRVVALVADLHCFPCNKNETCAERYDCLGASTSKDVLRALDTARTTGHLVILKAERGDGQT